MDKNIVVPVLLFLCVTYAFKLLLDARLRWLLFKAGSPETVAALLAGERVLRQQAALQGGLVALGLGLALALVEALGWTAAQPGTWALGLIGLGAGRLLSFALERRGVGL